MQYSLEDVSEYIHNVLRHRVLAGAYGHPVHLNKKIELDTLYPTKKMSSLQGYIFRFRSIRLGLLVRFRTRTEYWNTNREYLGLMVRFQSEKDSYLHVAGVDDAGAHVVLRVRVNVL